ncbi:transposase [Corynebacterium choanae]|uniref:transposase n=1 Tax=Corynebacterium choanae TaxID=1862358 RepID=UPI0036111238
MAGTTITIPATVDAISNGDPQLVYTDHHHDEQIPTVDLLDKQPHTHQKRVSDIADNLVRSFDLGVTLTDAAISDQHTWVAARLLDMLPGRSTEVSGQWLQARGEQFRTQVEVVAMDGFRRLCQCLQHTITVTLLR